MPMLSWQNEDQKTGFSKLSITFCLFNRRVNQVSELLLKGMGRSMDSKAIIYVLSPSCHTKDKCNMVGQTVESGDQRAILSLEALPVLALPQGTYREKYVLGGLPQT